MTYFATMATLYECPECGVVRLRQMDILSHCRNVEDHREYDYERLKSILDGDHERELNPAGEIFR
jgi:hypothetical protein